MQHSLCVPTVHISQHTQKHGDCPTWAFRVEAVLKAVFNSALDSTTLRRPFQRRAPAAPPPLFSSSDLDFISCCCVVKICSHQYVCIQLLLALVSCCCVAGICSHQFVRFQLLLAQTDALAAPEAVAVTAVVVLVIVSSTCDCCMLTAFVVEVEDDL